MMRHYMIVLFAAAVLAGCAKKETPSKEDEPAEKYHVRIEAINEPFSFYDAAGEDVPLPEATIKKTYDENIGLGQFHGTHSFSLEVVAKEPAGPQDSLLAIYSYFTSVSELTTDVEYIVSMATSRPNVIPGRLQYWADGEEYEGYNGGDYPRLTFSEITPTHVRGTFRGVLRAYDYESWTWKDKYITITSGEFFVPIK